MPTGFYGKSLKRLGRLFQSAQKQLSCAMKRASPFEFEERSMETETWSEFQNGGKLL